MAGYILKIVLEDTHPPVWRRVIIPERISFYELHLVIQCLFGWEDCHLHGFSIPSERIFIDEEESSGFWDAHYPETTTPVDHFFPDYKWIRYTYDFGDDWRHKIIFEKTDESYKERYTTLLKVKGGNFEEDTGGIWANDEDGGARRPPDVQAITESLRKLVFPTHEDLDAGAEPAHFPDDEKRMMSDFFRDFLDQMESAFYASSHKRKSSPMALKIESWKQFCEESFRQTEEGENAKEGKAKDGKVKIGKAKNGKAEKEKTGKEKAEKETVQDKNSVDGGFSQMILPFLKQEDMEEPDYVLEIVSGTKSCAELLRALSLQEARDYCKYLQIPCLDNWTKAQMTCAIAQELCAHPEYLLYVLYEEELREYLHLAGLPNGRLEKLPEDDTLIKALDIGLADIQIVKRKGKTRATLSFATDIPPLLRSLPAALRKKTYRDLRRFSEKLRTLVLVYGLIDFDSLRGMFQSVYHTVIAPEDFCRYIYWHGTFNNLLQTLYRVDSGKAYAAAIPLDADYIMERMLRYSKDLEYASFSEKKLREMADSISGRSDWAEVLYDILLHEFKLPEEMASVILELIFPKIMEGRSLPFVIESMLHILPEKSELSGLCELWWAAAGLLLELELPMLKGRSRQQYAKEKGISAWDIDMVEEEKRPVHIKERHMYEFDRSIQEAMFQAVNFVSERDIKWLEAYLQEEKIHSEEFLYLLAEANIIGCRFQEADSLIRQLRKSSSRGKKGAEDLQEMLETGINVTDESEEDDDLFGDGWLPPVSQTYVREAPKIGRNDPCPCGSGKKYKRCCGRGL